MNNSHLQKCTYGPATVLITTAEQCLPHSFQNLLPTPTSQQHCLLNNSAWPLIASFWVHWCWQNWHGRTVPTSSHQLPQHCYHPATANPTQRYTSQHLRSGCQSFHRFHNNLIKKEEYHINFHYTHRGTYSAHYKHTDLEKSFTSVHPRTQWQQSSAMQCLPISH